MRPTLIAVLACALATACDTPRTIEREIAEKIYRGGSVLTMNDAQPEADAVAIARGRIIAVGNDSMVLQHRGDTTEIVELSGNTLMPGFIDSHSHFHMTAVKLATVAMDPPPAGTITSIADIKARLERELQTNPHTPHDWLVGWGYDNAMLSDARHPTKFDLDEVSAEVPILLVHFSGHQSVLNSRALELMGITADSDAPEGGVIQRVANSREPNGILEETAHIPGLFDALQRITNDNERLSRLLGQAAERYASRGYTTVSELAASPDSVAQLKAFAATGALPFDLVAFQIYLRASAEEVAASASTEYTNRFRVAGCKFNLDGGSPGRTAYLREPYHIQHAGEEGYRGYPAIREQTRVNDLVAACYREGLPVAIHALGDAAVDQAILAISEAERRHPGSDRRTQLIHLQMVQEDQFDTLKALDVTMTFQVAHNFYFGDFHRETIYGPQRTDRLNPVQSALERGISVTLHHDSPIHPVDQFMLMWAAVNRVTRSGRVIGAAQQIGTLDALKASTINAAYQFFEEDYKGSIEVGKLADFVIVDDNPLTTDAAALRDIQVIETIKDGKTIWLAPSKQAAI